MSSQGRIHLIPNLISDSAPVEKSVPASFISLCNHIKHYLVENERNARRYLKKLDRAIDIDSIQFFGMGKHAEEFSLEQALRIVEQGNDLGVISDAGCPGVADPGSQLIAKAQAKGIQVIPHVGPSSILMTLMASGFNGQHFTFHGYLAKEKKDRSLQLKEMARSIRAQKASHLFMDTPFRNMSLFQEMVEILPADIKLCIARDITGEREWIKTMPIRDWKNARPDINKIPVMFAIGH